MTGTVNLTSQEGAIYQLARTLLDEHSLTDWSVGFDRRRKRSAACNYDHTAIMISLVVFPRLPEWKQRDTILHEIAHALTPNAHHGDLWKLKCLEVGARPERAYGSDELSMAIANWVGTCPNGHHNYRIRLTDRAVNGICCGRCTRVYDDAYRFTWKRIVR